MRKLEKRAKCCYANDFNLDRNYFVKMLLLDGCFVLMSLIGTEWYAPDQQESENSNGKHDVSEHKISSNSVLNEKLDQDEGKLETIHCDIVSEDIQPIDQLYSLDFWHDVLLLENQIPFFIISELYELIEGGSSTATAILIEKVNEIVEGSLYCYPKAVQNHSRPKEFFHLLHLCHLYFRPRIVAAKVCENYANPSILHNLLQSGSNTFSKYEADQSVKVSKLHNRQFHHVGRQNTSKQVLTLRKGSILLKTHIPSSTCNGILEIPGFTIEPNTQSLFSNLLAFEQTCPQFGNHFTTYITFFCGLIRKPDDVALLTKRGIIVHQLNSEADVCDLFRMIMECAVSFSRFNGGSYLGPVCSKIEAQYQNRRPVLREFLSSITSKVHGWTQESESSESLMTTSEEVPV